jgi:hypothetical protein
MADFGMNNFDVDGNIYIDVDGTNMNLSHYLIFATNHIFSSNVNKKKSLREKKEELDDCLSQALKIYEEDPDDTEFLQLVMIGYCEENEKIYLAYCLKFKDGFIKWLWKSRQKKIMEQLHPKKINDLLNSGINLNDLEEHV